MLSRKNKKAERQKNSLLGIWKGSYAETGDLYIVLRLGQNLKYIQMSTMFQPCKTFYTSFRHRNITSSFKLFYASNRSLRFLLPSFYLENQTSEKFKCKQPSPHIILSNSPSPGDTTPWSNGTPFFSIYNRRQVLFM